MTIDEVIEKLQQIKAMYGGQLEVADHNIYTVNSITVITGEGYGHLGVRPTDNICIIDSDI